jgi:hypothetical protein
MATNNAVQNYMPPTFWEAASMFEKLREESSKNERLKRGLNTQNLPKATALRNLFSMDNNLLNLNATFG